jgi:hypothetical protein
MNKRGTLISKGFIRQVKSRNRKNPLSFHARYTSWHNWPVALIFSKT